MSQEIKNLLTVFVAPIIIGLVFRLVFIKSRKGFLVTVFSGGVTLLMFLLSVTVDTHGNEFLGIWFLITLFTFLGSVAMEIVIFLSNRIKQKRSDKIDFLPE